MDEIISFGKLKEGSITKDKKTSKFSLEIFIKGNEKGTKKRNTKTNC